MSPISPDEQRAVSRERWEGAAAGWGRHADGLRDWGLPVSVTMVDALALQPGQTVLELAAGPGDTGFMAAELIAPGGRLISSDGAEAMVTVARERAQARGLQNVEFRQLELEWIDLEAASVDAVLCRWGIMLLVDPEAAAREMRRVLKPGGRAAVAVWDASERNPWATVLGRVMVSLGHTQPPEPGEPGPFALGRDGALAELLQTAGFTEVTVAAVALERGQPSAREFIAETTEMSPSLGETLRGLSEGQREEALRAMEAGLSDYTGPDGSVLLPGSSLVAVATA